MSWPIIILIIFALGFEAVRLARGGKCDWKKALVAFIVAALIGAGISWLIG